MPIDRVFTMSGFGTIVTGTLWSGVIQEGDRAVIEPGGLEVRIRGIQVYGQKSATARAGQRTAINIPGVECIDLERGHVITKPGTLKPGHMLDANFKLLKKAPLKELHNGIRIRFYTGTAEAIGRLYLLDHEQLVPGEEALVQIRLETPVAAAYGDNYVIRLYSPMCTIGGGVLLDVGAVKRRRFDVKLLTRLREKAAGRPEALTYQILAGAKGMLTAADLQKGLPQFTLLQIMEFIALLIEAEKISQWEIDGTKYYLDKETEFNWLEEIREYLTMYHRTYSLRIGVGREELRKRNLAKLTQKQVQVIFTRWQQAGWIICEGQKVRLPSHAVTYKGLHKQWREKIEQEFLQNMFSPPDVSPLIQGDKSKNKEAAEVWESLLEQNIIVAMGEGVYFHRQAIAKAQEALNQYFATHEHLLPADFRDLIGSSRKYSMPLLAYFDSIGVTRRVNEYRIPGHI
jgi:selenocysteine-specific elongation factor